MKRSDARHSKDKHVRISLDLMQEILKDYHPRDFAVQFWDGTVWEAQEGQPTKFTLVLNHPGALRKMFLPPTELDIGEAYIFEDFDVEGDLYSAIEIGVEMIEKQWSFGAKIRSAARLIRLPRRVIDINEQGRAQLSGQIHSKGRDKSAVAYHYNLSNDFYRLMLDQNMVYSCGYFASPHEDLDTAQERKLDYLCRKLRLQPGERLLDIGCGWGGLILHAAKNYGVKARGITLSQPQADEANARIKAARLENLARADVVDYRDLNEPGAYDKLVSVGMFEHVGARMLEAYFRQAWTLLKPAGLFLNHGIAADVDAIVRQPSFVLTYVFPDSEMVPLSTTTRVAESVGFEVRDVEGLREHYVLTIQRWAKNLEKHEQQAIELVGKVNYRVWHLATMGAIYGFKNRKNNLYQILMSKPDNHMTGLPLTRADWYANGP